VSGYVLSAEADLDLDEIWDYIAADNIDAVNRWIDKLFDPSKPSGKRRAWAIGAMTSLTMEFCSGQSVLISSSTAPSVVRLRS